MSNHAGYAAAVVLRQPLLQGLMRILYHAGKIPHAIKTSSGGFSVDLFLDVPKIVCAVKNKGYLELDLTAWGAMTIPPLDGTKESHTVLVTATILAKPKLSLQSKSFYFNIDGANATLDSYKVTSLSGGALSAVAQALIDSAIGKNLIQNVFRNKLSSISQINPPIDASFLGDIADESNTTLTAKVLKGALAIGIDIDTGGVKTTGDPNLLTDVSNGYDIAMWQNPDALPIVMKKHYTDITTTVQKQGATLDSFSLTVAEGYFQIEGAASNTYGTLNFSAKAVPHLIRPGYEVDLGEDEHGPCILSVPDKEELWFEIQDKKIDLNKEPWVTFVEVITGFLSVGLAVVIIESYVQSALNGASGAFTQFSKKKQGDRNTYFTFEDLPEPQMRLRVETYECHTEGTYVGFTLRAHIEKPKLEGDTSCFIERVKTDPPAYELTLPFDLQKDDPLLMVRWIVRRTDTNEVLLQKEGKAASYLTLSLSSQISVLLKVEEFLIECRLYRALGSTTTDYFNDSIKLTITDSLDRSHPFVRWHHWVFTPIVQVASNNSRTLKGMKLTSRKSVIHRTDYPGRCKMVSKYEIGSPEPPRSPFGHAVPDPLIPAPAIEYLDQLPFDKSALLKNRFKVCDYCFFGGPDKSTPLI